MKNTVSLNLKPILLLKWPWSGFEIINQTVLSNGLQQGEA